MTDSQTQILASLGVSVEMKRRMDLDAWDCYSLNHNSKSRDVPILLVESGPKNITDIKRVAKYYDTCVIISSELKKMFVKTLEKTHTASLDSDMECFRIAGILKAQNVGAAKSETELNAYLENAIEAIPSTAEDFENRGLFSTHYLRHRIFDDAPDGIDVSALREAGNDVKKLLDVLGWKINAVSDVAWVVITGQENFSIRESKHDVAPSYTAVSELSRHRWVILTNGRKWRLYTSRISASSTNYFEVNLNEPSDMVLKYLGMIFGYASFDGDSPKIDLFLDQGKEFATQLEEDLASRIMSQDGVLLNLAKGILGHDMKTKFGTAELASAKETALRVIYRVWFAAYAESRNLLPASDARYGRISLRRLRGELDRHESDSEEDSCWKYLLNLFEGIRNGSPKNNLPQYNGDLFRHDVKIDKKQIQNRWLVPALRDLLERDGDTIDYASLSVRHLGNILENVMEFAIQQAKEDVMLLVKGKKIIRVKTSKKSNYSYRKNDLYLASKGGIAVRKSTASYYTPDEIVTFLVNRGLGPILADRSAKIADDVKSYQNDSSPENRKTCMERLLDIQVLDPTMGSGHFLVEALNRLTSWATEILREHPAHPLLEELEQDRDVILEEQQKKGIMLDANLLTHDVLLKRKMMKRCIFGVDLNPLAVEIAKLALWLDSFAIGMPLTYMDHHIRAGDSTIGMFLEDLEDKKNQSIDGWMPNNESNSLLERVSSSSDVTVTQVHQSEDRHRKYSESVSPTRRVLDALAASKIDDTIAPKKSGLEFVHRFGKYGTNEDKALKEARKKVAELSRRRFFHWDLEMRDAFTGSRRGFDVILGNPPWDKVKPFDDEFFTPYYPVFRSLSPKTKKNEVKQLMLNNKNIKSEYDSYLKQFKEKSSFYTTYEKQGSGDKELSKLILERSLSLLSKNGTISMVVPSQILSSEGAVGIRKEILDRDITQMFVFENRNKIFDIHSSWRFMLLTLKNSEGGDKFPVGFYLHHLSSLHDRTKEKEKFGEHSKEQIRKMFPESLLIPESIGKNDPLSKLYEHPKLGDGLGNGLAVSFSSGFHKTNDANLFLEDGKGWTVHEGKTIHQYVHNWSRPKFTARQRVGLERENKSKYGGLHKEFYDSYRLVFRGISSPTNMRTVIAAIVPPNTFHTNSLFSVMIKRDGNILLDSEYVENILYLCGVLNSLSFDFVARKILQVNVPAIIKKIPIPSKYKREIARLAAGLTVGHPDFAGLAEKMRIPNKPLSVSERIDAAARLDVWVAKSYGLGKDEYETILKSFKALKENPDLRDMKETTWNNKNIKEFYGEMRKKAMEVFDETP